MYSDLPFGLKINVWSGLLPPPATTGTANGLPAMAVKAPLPALTEYADIEAAPFST
jgi:hypothetical protein